MLSKKALAESDRAWTTRPRMPMALAAWMTRRPASRTSARPKSAFPWGGGLHGFLQMRISLGRHVQPGLKRFKRLRTDRHDHLVQQSVFCRQSGRVQDEVSAIFAPRLCRTVDEIADLGLDANIERFAFCFGGCLYASVSLMNAHCSCCNDIVSAALAVRRVLLDAGAP